MSETDKTTSFLPPKQQATNPSIDVTHTFLPDLRTEQQSYVVEDPIVHLELFHQEIRTILDHFDALVQNTVYGARVDHLIASELVEFFTGPIVWHDIDEETLLLPALRELTLPERATRVLNACNKAHQKMESLISNILPKLGALAAQKATPDVIELRDTARRLRLLLEPHLAMEEKEIFPLARAQLPQEVLTQMGETMNARVTERRGEASPRASVIS